MLNLIQDTCPQVNNRKWTLYNTKQEYQPINSDIQLLASRCHLSALLTVGTKSRITCGPR